MEEGVAPAGGCRGGLKESAELDSTLSADCGGERDSHVAAVDRSGRGGGGGAERPISARARRAGALTNERCRSLRTIYRQPDHIGMYGN
jgi:hypothetical protein